MKLKYYLRALGLGIFVTALILTVSSGLHGMSDDDVRQRAKELGMTEAKNQVLSDVREQQNTEASKEAGEQVPSASQPEEVIQETEEGSESSEPVEESKADTQPESMAGEGMVEESIETGESIGTGEPSENPEPEETIRESEPQPEAGLADEMVEIEIVRGDSSQIVAQKLFDAGLVTDAKAYDRFLCSNRYDYGIRIGTYQIAKGSTNEQIAKIITGN